MHVGAAVGTRTLVLIGRGITPEVWGPYGNGHNCLKKDKIEQIGVTEIFEEALKMLS